MKVYLIVGNHPFFSSFSNPPKDVQFHGFMPKQNQLDNLTLYDQKFNYLKNVATTAFNCLKSPRIFYVRKNCDLIHTSGVIPLNRKPWVVDVERASSFFGLQEKKLYERSYRKKVEKMLSSPHCKKVMPHNEASKKSILNAYDTSGFEDKIEVVYPAIEPLNKEKNKTRNDEKIKLLLISNTFYDKGEKELLQAFDILDKKYDIELTLKARIPESIREKYKGKDNLNLVSDIVSRDELFNKYYLNSDIFVLPTYIDSFGFVFLEAASAGLPLVGNNIFAVPEIIEDGKNGFLIDTPVSWFGEDYLTRPLPDMSVTDVPIVVEQLVDSISQLIEDDKLRKSMGNESLKMIEKGKFSITERNKKLKQIYDECMS